jgi:DNA-binding transcriptional LysR family regulator
LTCFRAVANLGGVTRAAVQLGVPQPAVSRTLAGLESDLGLPLFEREGRGVRLTAYGRAFLPYAEAALGSLEDGFRELNDLRAGTRGTIALGFLRTLAPQMVPKTVRSYRETHPHIDFTFHQARSVQLERQLIAGELHLCMTTLPQRDDLAWQPMYEQKLSIIVPTAHPLAGRASVAFADLASEPFIAFFNGHATRVRLEELSSAAGFQPKIALECDEAGGIRGFVAAGFGIALAIEPQFQSGIVTLPLSTPGASRTIGVAWRRRGYVPAAACAFRDALLAQVATN